MREEKREKKEKKERRKIRKGKLILTAVLIVVVIAVIAIISGLVKNKDKKGSGKDEQEKVVIYDLPDVTYSDMQVKDIEMEYLADNNETMVTMTIDNTTQNVVQQESLTAYLIDGKDNTIGETKTYIELLNPGEQYSISVILKGDLTSTKQIKLQK